MEEDNIVLRFRVVNIFVFIPLLIIIVFGTSFLTGEFGILSRLFFLMMIGLMLGSFLYLSFVLKVVINKSDYKLIGIIKEKNEQSMDIKTIRLRYWSLFKQKWYFLILNDIVYIIDIPDAYSNPTPNDVIRVKSEKAIALLQEAIDHTY